MQQSISESQHPFQRRHFLNPSYETTDYGHQQGYEKFDRLDRASYRRNPKQRVTTEIGKLGDELEKTIDDAVLALQFELIYPNLSEFFEFPRYKSFTKTPEGNRVAKNIKSRIGQEKQSHQEFRFDHLKTVAGRKKYGRKFVEKLRAWNRIDNDQYQHLLEVIPELPRFSNENDDLENALLDYWTIPQVIETSYGDSRLTKQDMNNIVAAAPMSGFPIMQTYLHSRGEGAIAHALICAEELKLVKEYKGDRMALKYFFEVFLDAWTSAVSVERLLGEQPEQLEIYEERIVEPLQKFASYARGKLEESIQDNRRDGRFNLQRPQATLKSAGLDARRKKINVKEELYWC